MKGKVFIAGITGVMLLASASVAFAAGGSSSGGGGGGGGSTTGGGGGSVSTKVIPNVVNTWGGYEQYVDQIGNAVGAPMAMSFTISSQDAAGNFVGRDNRMGVTITGKISNQGKAVFEDGVYYGQKITVDYTSKSVACADGTKGDLFIGKFQRKSGQGTIWLNTCAFKLPAPTSSLFANGLTLINVAPGEQFMLTWDSTNADQCYKYGNWGAGEPVAESGSEVLTAMSPDVSTGYLYEIMCYQGNSLYSQSGVQVNVLP